MARSDTADESDPTLRIGERLGALRRERGIKVAELARGIGVSSSMISQIEGGRSRPSVATLFALSQELGVSIDAFFGGSLDRPPARGGEREAAPALPPAPALVDRASAPGATGYVMRRGSRPTVDIQGGVRWERLSAAALDDLEFMELIYEPGAESDGDLYRHPGFECVLVLENRLDIVIESEVCRLDEGDSMAFPSSVSHRYTNPTDQRTRAVTAILRSVPQNLTS